MSTLIQEVNIAISQVKLVHQDTQWNTWADKWLSSEDRSPEKARQVAVVAGQDAYAKFLATTPLTAIPCTDNGASPMSIEAYAARAAQCICHAARHAVKNDAANTKAYLTIVNGCIRKANVNKS